MPSDIVAGRQPGFWSQAFGKVYQLANDTGGQMPWGAGQPKSWKEQGTGLIDAGYKGIEFPDHFSPWPNVYWGSDLGQRWVASFCTKLLQDYYDYTMNTTFLRHHAYPLTKLNGEFYLSYMTRQDGRYNVMHGCGMEGCNAQGANESGNLTFSNNAPPVRRKYLS